jgi:hypothetical protein
MASGSHPSLPKLASIGLLFSLFLCSLGGLSSAQSPVGDGGPLPTKANTSGEFRLERVAVPNGSEILTIFGSLEGIYGQEAAPVVPLVSVLRDTLGDNDPENDRLRYVWALTYARPSKSQRFAAFVPFLYGRFGKQKQKLKGVPRPVLDVAEVDREVWDRFLWVGLQAILLDPYGIAVKASTRNYRRNVSEYRKSQIVRALGALALYQAQTGTESVFSPTEFAEIQARLSLNDKMFGGLLDEVHLNDVYEKNMSAARDTRGHNWELLRQRAEAESLIFEPLKLPDGSATHAIIWVTKNELASNAARSFSSRFLNIKNPWSDAKLKNWKGYTEVRFLDSENRSVPEGAEGARAVEMIPLAIYGLDQPNIPLLLIDFRDTFNPKKREMSRRVLEDVTRNILSLSTYGDIPYFLGRTVYDFVTGRRGMDINQPSRIGTYSQLKLLVSLDSSLDPGFRKDISQRMERVVLNPLENDLGAEVDIARAQYEALVNYARRADGLAAQIDRDRREEIVPLRHGAAARLIFRVANVASFGLYTHRETVSERTVAVVDLKRRMKHHERFLREVARTSSRVEIDSDLAEVKRSLRFVADHNELATREVARATASIFSRTADDEVRELCLGGLYKINNDVAKRALLRIYADEKTDVRWRNVTADFLRLAVKEDKDIPPAEARMILSVVGQ